MKPYSKYKPSGVEWIGDIPEHWECKNLKHLTTHNNDTLPENTAKQSIIKYIEIGDVNSENGIEKFTEYVFENSPSRARRCIYENDILISSVRTYLKAISHVNKEYDGCIASTGFVVLRPKNINSKYLSYCVLTEGFISEVIALSKGVSYPSITSQDLIKIKISSPPLPEQTLIANFLDRKTTELDTLIANKQRLIELLKEERTAIINHAITKGINPNVKYKDSGIEWIGEIPEHWEVKRLRYLAKICNGQDQKAVLDEDGKYPIYGSGGIFGRANTFLYDKPSVLLGRKGTIDKPRLVVEPFWSVDTAFYTKIFDNVSVMYFYYLCCSINFDLYKYGSAVPSMTQGYLNEIKFSIPKLEEQNNIVKFIEIKTTEIDTIISQTEKEIDLLKEYKTALINEVVLGKVDVSGVEI